MPLGIGSASGSIGALGRAQAAIVHADKGPLPHKEVEQQAERIARVMFGHAPQVPTKVRARLLEELLLASFPNHSWKFQVERGGGYRDVVCTLKVSASDCVERAWRTETDGLSSPVRGNHLRQHAAAMHEVTHAFEHFALGDLRPEAFAMAAAHERGTKYKDFSVSGWRALAEKSLGELPTSFQDAVLRRSILRGAVLDGTTLKGLNFRGLDLRHANFNECRVQDCNFDDTDMTEVYMQNATIVDCSFKRARMVRANLMGSSITKSRLDHATLDDARLPAIERFARVNLDAGLTRASFEISKPFTDRFYRPTPRFSHENVNDTLHTLKTLARRSPALALDSLSSYEKHPGPAACRQHGPLLSTARDEFDSSSATQTVPARTGTALALEDTGHRVPLDASAPPRRSSSTQPPSYEQTLREDERRRMQGRSSRDDANPAAGVPAGRVLK